MTVHSFSGGLLAASMPGLLVTPTFTAQETQPPSWSYSGADNPKRWGKLDPAYSACSLGRTQSPIDVTNAKTADLPVLKFDYQAVPLNIIDNGHTIQVNYAPRQHPHRR